jgi:hypothetical protein
MIIRVLVREAVRYHMWLGKSLEQGTAGFCSQIHTERILHLA